MSALPAKRSVSNAADRFRKSRGSPAIEHVYARENRDSRSTLVPYYTLIELHTSRVQRCSFDYSLRAIGFTTVHSALAYGNPLVKLFLLRKRCLSRQLNVDVQRTLWARAIGYSDEARRSMRGRTRVVARQVVQARKWSDRLPPSLVTLLELFFFALQK